MGVKLNSGRVITKGGKVSCTCCVHDPICETIQLEVPDTGCCDVPTRGPVYTSVNPFPVAAILQAIGGANDDIVINGSVYEDGMHAQCWIDWGYESCFGLNCAHEFTYSKEVAAGEATTFQCQNNCASGGAEVNICYIPKVPCSSNPEPIWSEWSPAGSPECGQTLTQTRYDIRGCSPQQVRQVYGPPCPEPAPSLECISVSAECSTPVCGEINPADGKRYLTVTTVHTDGHVSTVSYSLGENGECNYETTCEGVVTTTQSESYSSIDNEPGFAQGSSSTYNKEFITTVTYNPDCSTTTTYSGSSSSDYIGLNNGEVYWRETCSSTVNPDGSWSGTGSSTFAGETNSYEVNSSCGLYWVLYWLGGELVANTTVSPTPTAANVTTYSNQFIPPPCTLPFPDWPSWPSDEQSEFQSGQGNYCGAFRDYSEDGTSKTERKAKWRLAHQPSSTCYLKVWLKRVFTPAATEGNPFPYPEEIDLLPYVWSSGSPCSSPSQVYGPSNEETLSENGSTEIIISKYSYVEGYEPADGEPNGFPPS